MQPPAVLQQAARRPPPARQAGPAQQTSAHWPPPTAIPVQGGARDLLGGNLAAGPSGFGTISGGAFGSGFATTPPQRPKKTSGNGVFIILIVGAIGFMLLVCGGVAVFVAVPAYQIASKVAAERQMRDAVLKSRSKVGRTSASLPTTRSSSSPSGFPFGRSNPPSPVWGPNPQYAAQLPTRVNFDRFSMQLPQGFAFHQTPPEPVQRGIRTQSWVWFGPPTFSGARCAVEVDVVDFSGARGVKMPTPDELSAGLPKLLSKLAANGHIVGFRHDPGERGQIAGRECIRTKFSGLIEVTQVVGIAYLMLDGQSRLITMSCLLPEGSTNPPRDVLEASFLTMQ